MDYGASAPWTAEELPFTILIPEFRVGFSDRGQSGQGTKTERLVHNTLLWSVKLNPSTHDEIDAYLESPGNIYAALLSNRVPGDSRSQSEEEVLNRVEEEIGIEIEVDEIAAGVTIRLRHNGYPTCDRDGLPRVVIADANPWKDGKIGTKVHVVADSRANPGMRGADRASPSLPEVY